MKKFPGVIPCLNFYKVVKQRETDIQMPRDIITKRLYIIAMENNKNSYILQYAGAMLMKFTLIGVFLPGTANS